MFWALVVIVQVLGRWVEGGRVVKGGLGEGDMVDRSCKGASGLGCHVGWRVRVRWMVKVLIG